MAYLSSLTITGFRNYETAHIDALESGFVILTGANGAGKTNILEAVSLFAPGRGLRNAKVEEVFNKELKSTEWALSTHVETNFGSISMGTGALSTASKRMIRIQGEAAKSQNALAEYLSVLWLTPQMDGLFLGGSSDRRRFFDRMIYVFDPAHAGRLTRYENAMRQRSKLLQGDEPAEPAWLESLETTMAETAVALSAARLEFIKRLNQAVEGFKASGALKSFPLGHFKLTGFVEEALGKRPALEVEETFKASLKNSRGQDARRGGAEQGPHKSDIVTMYLDKNVEAQYASTGEQKALLTGIILSFALMKKAETGIAPILLLDEIAAHFDESRRAELFDLLTHIGGQIWMTGTDAVIFKDVPAAHYMIENKSILKA